MEHIIAPLISWFEQNCRPLPWRQDTEPYHVWISEIMLQQTRIEAVLGYYARFMQALPDVKALSEADDDRLLKLWEGLGYYSRARNLKKAAQAIMTTYGGAFPSTRAELLKLPGIGDYTAGAIASICFNEKTPAVDGNVLRVTARLTADRSNVLLPATKKAVTARLTAIMPEQPGLFNEALMELGETVCLPSSPACGHCPLSGQCAALRDGLTEALPVRIKQLKRKSAEKTVFLITAPDGTLAIEKRGEAGLLSGMYQLPNIDGYHSDEKLTEVLTEWGTAPASIAFSKNAKHVFTHIDWLMKGYRVAAKQKGGRFIWVSEQELQGAYPLPTAFRKLLK